jgi:iron(III) transport system substrate-binding protein
VFDLTGPAYEGKLGVAPANGSFQDFVTAMRELHGDDTTLAWLQGLEANNAQTYANNTAVVQAVGRGEVPFGLVNHYYNLRVRAEDPGASSENYYFPDGDIGSLLIVTAAGVLDSSDDAEMAGELIAFMLGETAQTFYARETLEYPLASGVDASNELPPLATLNVATYDFDRLGGGLGRTKELIDESGLEAP